MEKKNKNFDYFFLAAALIFPIYIRVLYPATFHHFDVGTFGEWIAYATPFHQIYETSCYCNYPIIGMFLSTGVLKLLHENYFLFLIYLAFFEVINTLLVYKILDMLKIDHKGLFCFIFMILPSTWSGGALWGQIDHIGMTFILLILMLMVRMYQNLATNKSISFAISFPIGFLFYLALFTKQLMVFPLFPIGIALLLIIYKSNTVKNKVFVFLSLLFGFLVPFIALETWLSYPSEYQISHYQHVLKNGSDHMDIISGNGNNIWLFFYSELEQASTHKIGGIVSPKTLGIIFTLLAGGWIFTQYVRKSFYSKSAVYQLALLSLTIAAFSLAFNLFLTGTHERYLFYCYPFLLLAYIGFKKVNIQVSNWDKVLFFVGGICHGIFVLAILNKWLKVNDLHVNTIYHKLIALIHIVLLIRVMSFERTIKQNSLNQE